MTNRPIYLVIIHSAQTYVPTVKELVEHEFYKDDIKICLDNCKAAGDLEKQMKKLVKKHSYNYVEEQVFLLDKYDANKINQATLVIDVSSKKVVKNRKPQETNEELMNIYLEKYKEQIEAFNK